MIKDVYEDYKRYKSDQEENNKEAHVYKDGTLKTILWKDIKVGDIIRVNKNEFFPCDLLLLASSDYKTGQCFIETKNLDGETNLKAKTVSEDMKSYVKGETSLLHFKDSIVNAEGPNPFLWSFKGSFVHSDTKFPLNSQNLLLRGCILRNTDYIVGCAIYTG
jgi:P-type E1-E2 ATPase